MAVVVYKCDTCKREIELVRNPIGLEVMSHCVITNNCKGVLHQTDVKSSHIRGKLPDPDPSGLQDWIPRQVYFKMNQEVPLIRWKVNHNLNTNPSLQVHVYLDDGSLIETTDYTYNMISPHQIDITFDGARRGIVQCFTRSPSYERLEKNNDNKQVVVDTYINTTGSGVMTFAVPATTELNTLKIGFVSASTSAVVYHEPIAFTTQTSPLSPWWKQLSGNSINKVFFSGKTWDVRTARFDYLISSTPSIVLGSTFFFTVVTPFVVNGVNTFLRTVTVNGQFDDTLLVSKVVELDTPLGREELTVINTEFNIATQQTTIKVLEPIHTHIVGGTLVVDYPAPNHHAHILMTDDPYSTVDKNITSTIHLNDVSYTNAAHTTCDSTHLYINTLLSKQVFPHIVV